MTAPLRVFRDRRFRAWVYQCRRCGRLSVGLWPTWGQALDMALRHCARVSS